MNVFTNLKCIILKIFISYVYLHFVYVYGHDWKWLSCCSSWLKILFSEPLSEHPENKEVSIDYLNETAILFTKIDNTSNRKYHINTTNTFWSDKPGFCNEGK